MICNLWLKDQIQRAENLQPVPVRHDHLLFSVKPPPYSTNVVRWWISEKNCRSRPGCANNTSNLSFQIRLKNDAEAALPASGKYLQERGEKKMKISGQNVVLNLFCVLALDMHVIPFSFLILIDLRKYIENFQRSCTVGSTNPNFYPCKSECC